MFNIDTQCSFSHIFPYPSMHITGAFVSSALLFFILAKPFMWFCQKHFRSKTRSWLPQRHETKHNTPTMGGLLIFFVFFINCLMWQPLGEIKTWLLFFLAGGFGCIGFLDDWYKIKYEKGIQAKSKFFFQILIATVATTLWYIVDKPDTHLLIPLFDNIRPDLGILLIPFSIIVIVGTSNGVNLTDGLDGLAAGSLIPSFFTYGFIAYATNTPHTVIMSVATIIGSLIAFLWYNAHPARIFMGDVGSLPLGASLAMIALFTGHTLLLVVCGCIFVLETLSVIMQVASFKLRKKRIFLMAPLHHHFELKGWKETKIITRFWFISLMYSLLALAIFVLS